MTSVEKIVVAQQQFRPSRGRSIADKTMMFLKEWRRENRRKPVTFFVECGDKRMIVFGSFRCAKFVAHKMRLENHASAVVTDSILGIVMYELDKQ